MPTVKTLQWDLGETTFRVSGPGTWKDVLRRAMPDFDKFKRSAVEEELLYTDIKFDDNTGPEDQYFLQGFANQADDNIEFMDDFKDQEGEPLRDVNYLDRNHLKKLEVLGEMKAEYALWLGARLLQWQNEKDAKEKEKAEKQRDVAEKARLKTIKAAEKEREKAEMAEKKLRDAAEKAEQKAAKEAQRAEKARQKQKDAAARKAEKEAQKATPRVRRCGNKGKITISSLPVDVELGHFMQLLCPLLKQDEYLFFEETGTIAYTRKNALICFENWPEIKQYEAKITLPKSSPLQEDDLIRADAAYKALYAVTSKQLATAEVAADLRISEHFPDFRLSNEKMDTITRQTKNFKKNPNPYIIQVDNVGDKSDEDIIQELHVPWGEYTLTRDIEFPVFRRFFLIANEDIKVIVTDLDIKASSISDTKKKIAFKSEVLPSFFIKREENADDEKEAEIVGTEDSDEEAGFDEDSTEGSSSDSRGTKRKHDDDEDSENQLGNPILFANYLENFNPENGKKIQVTNGDTTITLETETAKQREQWVQAIKKIVPQIAEQAIEILPAGFKAVVNTPDDKYVFRNFDNFPEDITVTFDGNLDDIDASQNVRDIILNIIEKNEDYNWRQDVETYVNSIIPEVNGQSFSDEEPGDEGSGSLDGSGAFADKAQPGENEAPSTEKCNDVANMTPSQREQLKTELTGELSELTATMDNLLLRKGDLLKRHNDASALAIEKDRQKSVLEKNFQNAGLSERYEELKKNMMLARDRMQKRLVKARAEFSSVQEKIQPELDGINQQLKPIEELGENLEQLHITMSELDAELKKEQTQEMNLEKARGKLDECIKRINDFDAEIIRKRKLAELEEEKQEAIKRIQIQQEEFAKQQQEAFRRFQEQMARQQQEMARQQEEMARQGEEAIKELQEQMARKRKRIDEGEDSQDSETEDPSQSVLE